MFKKNRKMSQRERHPVFPSNGYEYVKISDIIVKREMFWQITRFFFIVNVSRERKNENDIKQMCSVYFAGDIFLCDSLSDGGFWLRFKIDNVAFSAQIKVTHLLNTTQNS